MIWLDITDPKYVLFFRALLPYLQGLDEVFITTRKSSGYDECARLLELFKIPHISVGGYGGAQRIEKFKARLEREKLLLELIAPKNPKIFITGVSVEGAQCAFGLGIPVVHFADTPIAGNVCDARLLSIVARLSLPLSRLIFYPFVLPSAAFILLGMQSRNIVSYPFIDVALWLENIEDLRAQRLKGKESAPFLRALGFKEELPIILVREEEYKAHYVTKQARILYESVHLLHQHLRANIVIMPRYESAPLIVEFGHLERVKILESKFAPQEFYPYIDVLLGGGGSMNLEACYLGIPTISVRSLFLFHDSFLLENGFMSHATNAQEVLKLAESMLIHARKDNKKAFVKEDLESAKHAIIQRLREEFYSIP
ncbi:DUF354 domain-containing protein [Helicobacter himalayensis]|uniref:DUF354 domain-containing protein n=1 Tax=Helicobacter himalayensis TaxID=1591088 RepID=UPI003D6E09CC